MNWQEIAPQWAVLANIATAVGLPFILVSTGIAAWSLFKQGQLARAAYASQLVTLAMPFNQSIANSPEAAALWRKGAQDFSSLTADEKLQYRFHLSNCMLVYENVLYQHNHGFLAQELYETWRKDIEQFVAEQNIQQIWPMLAGKYSPELCAMVQLCFPTAGAISAAGTKN